jgi:thioredoxin reductase (NADPH)
MKPDVTETPDPDGAFPRLTEEQIALLARHGERKQTKAGDVLFREGDPSYDFVVVLDGLVETVDETAGEERPIAAHGPGRFLGDLNLLTGGGPFFTAVVRQAGEVLVVPAERLRAILAEDTVLGDLILRAFLNRRSLFIRLGVGTKLIGSRYSPDTRRLREFLARNRIPHTWIDLEEDTEAEQLLQALHVAAEETPIVIYRGVEVLRNPTNAELAAALGLRASVKPDAAADLLIVGGGPAGLAAAVYGSSEGLETVLLEAVAPGGQAGTASRIENYLGFPAGVSGAELAERAEVQARKFGTRIVVPADATALTLESDEIAVQCGDERFTGRVLVIATGARYRKLPVPRLEELEGVSVFYAATPLELPLCLNRPVVVVGGGNSAGQAALFLAQSAAKVRLVVRGNDLGENMSRYLVDRIERSKRIEVLLQHEVKELLGETRLEGVVVEDTRSGSRQTLEADALFVFIGAEPCTAWLAGGLAVDRHGFVLTGEGGPAGLLETSRPGVFAAGDVRSGSVKRVAAAVGEGAMAVQFVHLYLAGASR